MPANEVILHIAPRDPGRDAFPLALRIPGEAPIVTQLPAAELAAGPWTPATLRERLTIATPRPDLATAGRTIASWILRDAIGQRWNQLAAPAPPRILLNVDAPEFAGVPWELLCSGKPDAPIWLGTLGLVRLRSGPATPDTAPTWPRRFLLVVGCSEADEQRLGVDAEIATLERTLLPWGRSIDLHVLRRPAAAELEDWIQRFQPHVFHFAGHAGRDPDTQLQGLYIAHPTGTRVWDVAALPTFLLQCGWRPRFVFLNACRTAAATPDSASVQNAFLEHGVPAVLAMQSDIRGSLAGIFAARLYRACAEGRCIKEACRLARQALLAEGLAHQYLNPEWAIPALTLAHPAPVAGETRPLFPARNWPDTEPFRTCSDFEDARFFANCREQRRAVVQWVLPVENAANPAEPPPASLILHGVPCCGKSHLAKWCLESLTQPDLRIRYVTHRPPGATNFLELLRQIRDGEPPPLPGASPIPHELLHGPLPSRHFHRCHRLVNHVLQHGRAPDDLEDPRPGLDTGADAPASSVPDLLLPLRPLGENVLSTLCAAFLDALESVVRETPLLLAFDLLTAPDGTRPLDPKHLEIVLRRVLLPIARHPDLVGRLRLLFVVNNDDLHHYRLAQMLEPDVRRVEVRHDYGPEDLDRFALEMFQHKRPDLYAKHVELSKGDTQSRGLARLKILLVILNLLQEWRENLWVDRMR